MCDWSHSAFQYRVLRTLVVLWDPLLNRWAQHRLSHILTTVILQHFFHFHWHTQKCFYLIYTSVCHYFILHCFKCCKIVILITLSHIVQDAVHYSCTVYILLASSAEFLFVQLFIHTHYTSVTMCPLGVTWRNRPTKCTVVYSLFHVLWSWVLYFYHTQIQTLMLT